MKTYLKFTCFSAGLFLSLPTIADISASGGQVSYASDGYILRTFTSSGTLKVSSGGTVELLLIAGGGGGAAHGGGGGAGGLIYKESFNLLPGEYPVIIGEGGAGGINSVNKGMGECGSDSSFAGLIAKGGGGGGSSGCAGLDGGSGGGGKGANGNTNVYSGGSGVEGQGFSGGDGVSNISQTFLLLSGGGGGAGGEAKDCDYNTTVSTDGGTGRAFWQFNVAYTNIYYAGGGGGGGRMNNVIKNGVGGLGGGGRGSITGSGADGLANTGGGGGGGAYTYSPETDWFMHPGGKGGSGILVIRYNQAELNIRMECSGGDFVEKDGEYEIRTFTKDGVFTADKLGTVEVLVVGGGGGGGSLYGGGGGGGGVLHAHYLLTSKTVQVTVGAGGASDTDGENSSFGDLIAYGGGAGGKDITLEREGHNGGSGGGGSGMANYQMSVLGGNNVLGQGYPGGIGTNKWAKQGAAKPGVGGGGGGAGGAGGNASTYLYNAENEEYRGTTGCGGDGLMFSQFNKAHTNAWFAGGGSGGSRPSVGITIADAGKGGGGKGSFGTDGSSGEDAVPNSGGGGGGGGFSYYAATPDAEKAWSGTPGGRGGSGIVIVRYKRDASTLIMLR